MSTRALGRPLMSLVSFATVALSACVPAAAPGGPTLPDSDVPAGFGTLRQDDFTVTLASGALQIKVTPLEEWVIRLAAPDTYDRLRELAGAQPSAAGSLGDGERPKLFLVSVYSREPQTPFEPEDLILVNRGRPQRPLEVRGVTLGWGSRRVEPRRTEMAVYAYSPSVDLTQGLTVEYAQARSGEWDLILELLRTEQMRVRARAGAEEPVRSPARTS